MRPSKVKRTAASSMASGMPSCEFANGMPVYRFTAMTVSVKRSGELARIEQENAHASAVLSAVAAAMGDEAREQAHPAFAT